MELEDLDSEHSSVPNKLCDFKHSTLSLWASASSLVQKGVQLSKSPRLCNTLWCCNLSSILTVPSLTFCMEFQPNVKFSLISWSHGPSRSSGPVCSLYSWWYQITERWRCSSSQVQGSNPLLPFENFLVQFQLFLYLGKGVIASCFSNVLGFGEEICKLILSVSLSSLTLPSPIFPNGSGFSFSFIFLIFFIF